MTAVQIALFAAAAQHERAANRSLVLPVAVVHAAVLQEDEAVTFEPLASPGPTPLVVATAYLNLPAMIGGVTLASILHHESDSDMIGFTVLFVPLIWFPIGKWIDGQLTPGRPAKRRLAGSIVRWMLRAVSILGLLSCLFGFNGGWEGPSPSFEYFPLALWCTWYLFCSFWGERRLRLHWVEEEKQESLRSAEVR